MSQQALTDLAVRNLAAPESGQREVWDARLRGFGVRISHSGTKAFVLVYRFNGRPRRLTLGRYPDLSLSEARGAAQNALRVIARGTDPGAEKVRARHTPGIENFDAFVAYFLDTYARPKNRSAHETARLLNREFTTVWRSRPIGEITKHEVTVILDRIMKADKHTTANRSLAAIRKLFNWAVERGLLEQSPCAGIRAPARNVSRDRILTDHELIAVWKAATTMGYPYGPLVQLLILTGQRLNEVASMRWPDVDLDHRLWTIQADQNKSARTHVLPLATPVLQIILSLPRVSEHLVFPARSREVPVSGFGKWKAELDKLSNTSGWRIHDLRRTAATGMARLKVAPHVVERVLNHASGTFSGVAGVYNRFGYLPEMCDALDQWSSYVLLLVGTEVEMRA
ncbi:MAG: site-specific integrase [Hyphomicrobiaceae bacterium]